MPAKKNIIKDLRLEIKTLNDKLAGEKQHLAYREKQFSRACRTHEYELARINVRTNNLAVGLKLAFTKELTWMELCDDSDSKFARIQDTIATLKSIAAPVEEFNYDRR